MDMNFDEIIEYDIENFFVEFFFVDVFDLRKEVKRFMFKK